MRLMSHEAIQIDRVTWPDDLSLFLSLSDYSTNLLNNLENFLTFYCDTSETKMFSIDF